MVDGCLGDQTLGFASEQLIPNSGKTYCIFQLDTHHLTTFYMAERIINVIKFWFQKLLNTKWVWSHS